MPSHPRITLDPTDHGVITALQRDGRLSAAALAREVSLSASATAGRLGRLTGAGVITGYEARVDPEALGYTITAFVRLAYPSGRYRPVHEMLDQVAEIVEAHHTRGSDCFLLKVQARSMRGLERITGRVAGLGSITTSVVCSSPLPSRHLGPA